jgi:hypothetical protein
MKTTISDNGVVINGRGVRDPYDDRVGNYQLEVTWDVQLTRGKRTAALLILIEAVDLTYDLSPSEVEMEESTGAWSESTPYHNRFEGYTFEAHADTLTVDVAPIEVHIDCEAKKVDVYF